MVSSRPRWRDELSACIQSPAQLPLPEARRRMLAAVVERFPMRIPPQLARRIDWADPRCALRRQLVPDRRELLPGGVADPLDEERHRLGPGLIRRFGDRLLAQVSASCPVLCRHCNRKRHWTRPFLPAGPEQIAAGLERTSGIREVILSGGEPLLLSDRAIDRLLQAARSREGVELVRIHSRAPVSLAARITAGLVRVLRCHRPLWFVTHFNSAAELCPEARAALGRLSDAGIGLLNQAVLLRGVNDSLAAQRALGRGLVACGVKPHYLFQLDRAEGTLHFQVPLRRGVEIVSKLQRSSSGLLVPHLMVDLPGRGGKVPLGESAVVRFTPTGAWLRGADGTEVFYSDVSGRAGAGSAG